MNRQGTRIVIWTLKDTGAICLLVGGVVAALLGSLLTAIAWIVGASIHPLIPWLGTAFLILTIPLLILAGCCMDWAEAARKDICDEKRHSHN